MNTFFNQSGGRVRGILVVFLFIFSSGHAWSDVLYSAEFSSVPLGRVATGWKDVGIPRSSPNWAVDGQGLLRVVWKGETGVIVYEGALADGRRAGGFVNGTVSAEFRKTPEPEVFFAITGRVQDEKNFYALRFSGTNLLELVKVTEGEEEPLATLVTRSRYLEGSTWRLSLRFDKTIITGLVFDDAGVVQARVDALEERGFSKGAVGLQATNFAAAKNFTITAANGFSAKLSPEQIERKNGRSEYPGVVLKPVADIDKLNTPFAEVAESYDVIVAGSGTGGWAAALQASRMGARVLMIEETDWIGGQMAAAAVTSMDEEGLWEKFPVRERGIYAEFHQSIINYYYTLNKDPFRAYYAWPEQLEGGYEPRVVRELLYAFIEEERRNGHVLDLVTGTTIPEVLREGETVTGVVAEKDGKSVRIGCSVLVEATEYGDILPLAGARYRVGITTSDEIDPAGPIQYHTWLGVIREYPEGLPEELRIKSAPPGYDAKRYRKSQLYGKLIWGAIGKGYKGPRVYRVLLAWRGMADSASPMTGIASQQRHTRAGLNGGRQDYPVSVAGIEDLAVRRAEQREGIYRVLNEIYYFQHELGLPWSVAVDEGYDTDYNRRMMESRELREDLLSLAVHLPQWPYVRECRRGIGLYTLRASDGGRFEDATLFPTSVAMGDYFMDIDHGKTGDYLERDLDPVKPPRMGGPFQVPFEAFIPEKTDGLVFAEKNISQSRIYNGATRLQPITILTGQAAGAIAALAALDGVQPRQINPIAAQAVLLKAGSNLIQRWYEDVSWGEPLWQASQLLSLYGVMDVPGPIIGDPDKPMGGGNFWRPDELLDWADFSPAIDRLAKLAGLPEMAMKEQPLTWTIVEETLVVLGADWGKAIAGLAVASDLPLSRGNFAIVAASALEQIGKPVLLSDAGVTIPPGFHRCYVPHVCHEDSNKTQKGE